MDAELPVVRARYSLKTLAENLNRNKIGKQLAQRALAAIELPSMWLEATNTFEYSHRSFPLRRWSSPGMRLVPSP
jgi:hypothetical protein